MTSDIPRQVLSEHFQERIASRRVLGVLFLTYEFDPGFFEQEVLPAILDVAVSHAEVPRLLQLEGALRELTYGTAVFYDWRGLRTSGYASPRLDVQRIPVRLGTGIFHPKNVLMLTEDRDADDDGHGAKALLVACMSANLTRSGWWENVEVAHIETLQEGDQTRLREPLVLLLKRVQRLAANPLASKVLAPYRAFIHGLRQRRQKSQDGWLYPQMYVGGGGAGDDIAEFLADHVARESGSCLEVISPFFDESPARSPLFSLVKRLGPDEVRVYLPKDPRGTACVSEEMFDAARREGYEWGYLPESLLQLGRSAEAGQRSVHAKVYRIFKPHPKREYLFVGSANLTAAAHSGNGGNLETGFLIQVDPHRRPDFWLRAEQKKPQEFRAAVVEGTDDDAAENVPVQLRFSWKDDQAFGRWDGQSPCPAIQVRGQGQILAADLRWPSQQWVELSPDVSAAFKEELKSVSILIVALEDGKESRVLVQEEDMALKPELLRRLPIRDILEYWSLLNPEQRQAFLDSRAALLSPGELGGLMAPLGNGKASDQDMFGRCAGIFHAFATLERKVEEALAAKHDHKAAALLFGERFDSIGTLLDRVLKKDISEQEAKSLDVIDRYLVLMSAKQLRDVVSSRHQDFWQSYARQALTLAERLRGSDALRAEVEAHDLQDMPKFLDWFERWFLKRAESVVEPL